MDPALAAQALDRVCAGSAPAVIVADIDRERFARNAFSRPRPDRLLADLPEYQALDIAPQEPTEVVADLRGRLLSRPSGERPGLVLDVVCTQVAAVLGYSGPGQVETTTSFGDLGFDSVSAIELRNRLNAATGLTLPATLVFDHPSAQALARHVLGQLMPEEQPDEESRVRELLATLSLAQLRRSGLLDTLLQLADAPEAEASSNGHSNGSSDGLDQMDLDELVRVALQNED
nr:beta-ketoacyl reductase [Kineosporia rhizophila]